MDSNVIDELFEKVNNLIILFDKIKNENTILKSENESLKQRIAMLSEREREIERYRSIYGKLEERIKHIISIIDNAQSGIINGESNKNTTENSNIPPNNTLQEGMDKDEGTTFTGQFF